MIEGGRGIKKALKPKSRVIPRCRDWDDLSREAVERRVESVLTREVLPESTWPRTPTLRFRTRDGSNCDMSFGVIVPLSC